jgi:hypothetical protein
MVNTWKRISTHGYNVICATPGCTWAIQTVVGREDGEYYTSYFRAHPAICNGCVGAQRAKAGA